MKKSSAPTPAILPVATADGIFLAHYSDKGLVELNFPAGGASRPASAAGTLLRSGEKVASGRMRCAPPVVSVSLRAWHRLTEAALKKVLAGHAPQKLPPLDWSGTTAFQQSVWRELLKISPGLTKSYGEIATAIGRPRAVRAVGGACGANPVPVLVPCHRVLAAHGRLGGFSGGLDWKHRLLTREGIVL